MKLKGSILLLTFFLIFLVGCSSKSNINSIDHIHGSGYSEDGTTIYFATHEGLIHSSDEGKTWNNAGHEVIDLMGYLYVSDNLMISSGHPGKGSKLPNPVGLIMSEDQGETWKSISLLGKIDFHLLAMGNGDLNTIYGVNQMDSAEHKAGLYKSTDGGVNWSILDTVGLPDNLHDMISLIVLPSDSSHLMAGTRGGVLESVDGGLTWVNIDPSRIITAMQFSPNSNDRLISYSITPEDQGVMISQEQGRTWVKLGLDLGKDAISSISINPIHPDVIVASTFETSVYLSKDGGNTWEQIFDKGELTKR